MSYDECLKSVLKDYWLMGIALYALQYPNIGLEYLPMHVLHLLVIFLSIAIARYYQKDR